MNPKQGCYTTSGDTIVARRDQGARVFELAREFRMTERGVRKLLARVDAGRGRIDAKADMFGAAATDSGSLREP